MRCNTFEELWAALVERNPRLLEDGALAAQGAKNLARCCYDGGRMAGVCEGEFKTKLDDIAGRLGIRTEDSKHNKRSRYDTARG